MRPPRPGVVMGERDLILDDNRLVRRTANLGESPIAWLAQLSPATAGVQAFVPVNQMGAGPAAVARWLGLLELLCVVYGVWASWRLCGRTGPQAAGDHIDAASIER